MHPDIEQLNRKYSELLTSYRELYEALTDVAEKVKGKKYEDPVLIDLGYLCRRMEAVCDDMRKEAKVKKELISKVIAVRYVQEFVKTGRESPGTVLGESLARALPNVSFKPRVPRAGSPEYIQLCTAMGVKADFSERGIIDFHYIPLTEYLGKLAEDGKDPPPGITSTFPYYYCSFNKQNRKEDDDGGSE